MRDLALTLAWACALLGFACNNAPRGHEAVKNSEFTISATGNTMSDMAYDLREIRVQEGANVVINLVNKGTDAAMLHNIVIVAGGTEKEVALEGLNYAENHYFNPQNTNVVAGSAIAGPGTTVRLTFKAPGKGTYTYLCTYPGHWMKMQGVLIVE